MARFREFLADRPIEPAAYDIYPSPLHEPYRSSRFKVGEDMYATLGIGRDDKAGRLGQFAKNLDFFGAPAAIFCFIDRIMGPPQWSDLGMFLQTFMLLAQEAGLDTCPQEAWAVYEQAVSEFVGAPDGAAHLLRCGDRPRRPRRSDQLADHRARTARRLRHLRLSASALECAPICALGAPLRLCGWLTSGVIGVRRRRWCCGDG